MALVKRALVGCMLLIGALLPSGIASAALHVAAKTTSPGAPTITSVKAGNAVATVNWKAGSTGGLAVTYSVASSPTGGTCALTTKLTCIVKPLTNGTSYTFVVTAKNAKGSTSSVSSYPAVMPATVPSAPTGVTGYPGDRSIFLTWTAPTNTGGPAISNYAVTSSPAGLTCPSSSTTSCTLSNAVNGKAYTFTVKATNASGLTSPASLASAKVTPSAAKSICSTVAANQNYVGANLSQCNLSGLDLSNANFKNANLSNTNLGGTKLAGTILTGANLAGANLSGVQSGSITGAAAQLPAGWALQNGFLFGPGADLHGSSIQGVTLNKFNLSGVNLQGATISSSTLTNTNFSNASFSNAQLYSDTFDGSNFNGANFSNITISSGSMNGVTSGNIQGLRGVASGSGGLTCCNSLGSNYYYGNVSGMANPNGSSAYLPIAVYNGYLFGGGANNSGVDFSNNTFPSGAFLGNTNLHNANFSNVTANNADWSDSWMAGVNLTNASVKGGTFSAVDLTGATLSGADFTNVQMRSLGSNAYVELKNTNWSTVTMTGIATAGIDSGPTAVPSGWGFIGGYLVGPGANLSGQDLNSLNLSTVSLAGTNFTSANLSGANLRNASLAGTNFTSANLSGANLTGQDLSGATITHLNAVGIIGSPTLPANWVEVQQVLFGPTANIQSATLTNANLSGVNLQGATISSSTLTNTNFSNASFSNAQLYSDTFDGSNFNGANFSNITISSGSMNGVTSGNIQGLRGVASGSGGLTCCNSLGSNYYYGNVSGMANPNGSSAYLPIAVYNGYLFGGGANNSGVDFSNNTFPSGAFLGNTNLHNANFSNVTANNADWSDSWMAGVNLTNASVKGGTFSAVDLTGATLSGADFTGSNFRTNAVLSSVSLGGVIWTNCSFDYTTLSSDDLSNADLSDALLTGNMITTNLTGTDYLLPAGWTVVNGHLTYG